MQMRNSHCYYILHIAFCLACFPQAVTVPVHKLGIANPPHFYIHLPFFAVLQKTKFSVSQKGMR